MSQSRYREGRGGQRNIVMYATKNAVLRAVRVQKRWDKKKLDAQKEA